jgi:serine/threonine-protein kinase
MATIFLSYAHGDEEPLRTIRSVLDGANLGVVYDAQILAGTTWRDWLKEHVQQASVVIVLWSRRSAQRDFVLDEADAAQRSSVLVPLIIDDLEQVPFGFGQTQFHRVQWDAPGKISDASREHLLASVRAKIEAVGPLASAIPELRSTLATVLGPQYEILRMIGSGRLSVVFLVKNRQVGEMESAVKVTPLTGMLLQPDLYERFRQGLIAARELAHENVLSYGELRIEKGIALVFTRYVDGQPLSHCIKGTPLPLARVKKIARQLAAGLAHAHGKGVVHCNLRSSNILVDAEDTPVITDFGLARVRGRIYRAGAPTEFFLNATYVSPEQCCGDDATTRSDQYSLGVMLYEMLTGQPPFVGKSAYALMRQHCEDLPVPLSERRANCPAAVSATVMRLLQKKPNARFLVTLDLQEEIEAWPSYDADCQPSDDVCNLIKLANQCYERCLSHRPDFIHDLYEQLMEHEELRVLLEKTNFDAQVSALQRGIPLLLAFDEASSEHVRYMDRLIAVHRPLLLQRRQFEIFRDTLVQLVSETSAMAGPSDGPHGPALFAKALDATLARFIAAVCTDAAGAAAVA